MKFFSASGMVIFALTSFAAGAQEPRPVEGEGSPETPAEAFLEPSRADFSAQKLRGMRPDVAMSILSAEEGGALALEVLAIAGTSQENSSAIPVSVFVEIDGVSFLRAAQGPVARVDIYGYALTAEGGVADHFAEAFAVDLATYGERLWHGGFRFLGQFELPPSSFELRVMVREHASGAVGLQVVDFTSSPEVRSSELSVPILPSPRDREGWLTVRGARAPESPLLYADRPVQPATVPVMMGERTVRGYLPTNDQQTGTLSGHLVLTPATGAATRIAVQFEQPIGARPSDGRGLREFHLEVPKLDPGAYSFHAEVSTAGRVIVGPEIAVMVVAPNMRNRSLVWTDLRNSQPAVAAQPAGKVRRTQPDQPLKKQRRRAAAAKRGRELSARYAKVLADWAEHRTAVAKADLLNIEAAVLNPSSNVTYDELLAAEMGVLEKLASSDPESLVPIILLHQEIYLTYRQRQLFSLTAHARGMIEGTAKLYAERTSSAGARLICGDTLTSLGGLLLEANLLTASRRLFRDSLAMAPGRTTPQIALATSYERYGEFSKALEILEALHSDDPKFGEGTLRLAINLQRVGREDRARELLEELARTEEVAWIRSLAREELARDALERGDIETGTELLEELGDQRTLSESILLAHLYDRAGLHRSSLELLKTEDGSRSRESSSARKLYDSWPDRLLDRTRDRLTRASVSRYAALADTVSRRFPS